MSVRQLLITQSIFAKDLIDLEGRALGLMPVEDHRKLFSSLKILAPIYERLIWKRSLRELQQKQDEFIATARKARVDQLFEKMVKFYGGAWPGDVGFVIGLYPVPALKNFQNATRSTSYGSVEVHGVLIGVGKRDPSVSFGVIFHELCHSIYHSQPEAVMREIDAFFTESKSRHARRAYAWIDEALATALGNGWIVGNVKSEFPPKGRWYPRETIDTYAKALFPSVREYVEASRRIDKPFIDRAIELFAEKFPNAIYDYSQIMDAAVIAHEGAFFKSEELRAAVRSTFEAESPGVSSPLNNEETIRDAANDRATLLVVITPKEMEAFGTFAARFPGLAPHRAKIREMPARALFATVDERGRAHVVIKASSLDEVKTALSTMKTAGAIRPDAPVFEY